MHVALTIAGSDSGGGAGIQADLKTFHQFGVFGTSAITAITAQNTVGVRRWEVVHRDMVRAQIDAVVDDLAPGAVKSGMLGDAAVTRTVADAIREHRVSNYVLDPVMVATSGDVLLEQDAVASVRELLVPLATVVTPNLDEAALLLGCYIETVEEMRTAARAIVGQLGARAVLLKGGHLAGDRVVDVFHDGDTMDEIEHRRIGTRSTHGTGCTLSAAIAAGLARGAGLRDAVEAGVDFVHRALADAPEIGSGNGPLNHFVVGGRWSVVGGADAPPPTTDH